MKATINDVAALAGVSIKTVSRVMNKEPTVRKQTADKVWVAVKELSYQPNLAARNLAGNKSYAVGFIYDNPNAYYIIDMQNGILKECKNRGYDLIIHPCNAHSETIIDQLREMVRASRVAGLVLTPPFSESPAVLNALEKLDLQLVRIISGVAKTHPHIPHISIDDAKAAGSITQHMIEQGHKDIAFITGDMEHKSTDERLNGYKKALTNSGIRYRKDLVFEGRYSFESGVEGAKKLLSGKKTPTAIFACNDEIAAGALFAARLMGLEVPQQIAIAGFEDSPFSRQTWPKLTTAQQPNSEIAQLATSMLIGAIRRTSQSDKDAPAINYFEPQIVIRESTIGE